ncbi:MAG: hypothetical protein ACJ790_12190 [Myxococcaceae bacterium]
MRPLWVTLLLLGSVGCATNLSTLQTAKPIKRGQVEVEAGAGAYVNFGQLVPIISQAIKQTQAAKKAADTGEPFNLSEKDQQELLTAGIGLAVMPPSQGYELRVRTGLMKEDMDLGFRYTGNSYRLDTKYRYFHWEDARTDQPEYRKPSVDMAVGLAVSKYEFEGVVFDALDYVQLNDFSRWDIEVPAYFSFDIGDIVQLYAAPKYLWSRTSLDQELVNISRQATNITGFDVRLPSTVYMHFLGSSFGIAGGYKYAHLYLELTGGYTICDPKVGGQVRHLGGVTLYPAAGLALKFP